MFDVALLGAGPAGLSAAIYFARQKLSFVMIAPTFGGMALWSADVENYLGFHLLDGVDLVKQFRKHLDDYRESFLLKEGLAAQSVERQGAFFRIHTGGTEVFDAKTVLVATGTKHRELGVPGEREFYGKGITYCATCDAPLFKEKNVHVIGGGNSAMDAALFLVKYAAQVTIVTTNTQLSGDEAMRQQLLASPKVTILGNTKTTGFYGTQLLEEIGLQEEGNEERREKTEGVFIEIGLQPRSECVDFVAKDRFGQIIVDKYNATNVEGVWAAGDVTDITEKQIAIAVGEGSKAALEIIRFLQRT
jgi:thioredoxin reductase